MNDFNFFVTIPCLIWTAVFILGWSLDKLYKHIQTNRTRNTKSTKRV